MTILDTYLGQMMQTLHHLPRQSLDLIADVLLETYLRDGTVIVFGNGGSAASSSHFACDLMKWTARPGRRRMRALALTDNIPVMTAYANDQEYASIFVEQLEVHYRPGDTLFAISGSGNSPNVVRAVQWANERGAPTVGLTGFDGGQLAGLARYGLHVANSCMPQVEDAHSTICHALAFNLKLMLDQAMLEVEDELAPARPALQARVVG